MSEIEDLDRTAMLPAKSLDALHYTKRQGAVDRAKRTKIKRFTPPNGKRKSLNDHLYDVFDEICENPPE